MKTRIAYAGNFGSFSWKAAELAVKLNPFLSDADLIEALDPPTAIQKLWAGEVEYAVVPLFNHHLGGGIPASIEGFKKVSCPLPESDEHWLQDFLNLNAERIVGKPIPLPIEFAIHALPSVEPAEVTRLAAYSMAIAQCEKGIERMVKRRLEIVPYSDTAKSAHDLAALSKNTAFATEEAEAACLLPLENVGVLGPAWCDELFGLKMVYPEVQDNPQGNVTTFALMRNLL